MDLSKPIDIYCERLDIGIWAEPINAVTNAAFIFVAIFMWLRCKNLVEGRILSFILFSIPLFISHNMHPNIQFLTRINMGLLFLYTPVFKTFFGIKNIICSFIIANTILLSSVPFSTSIIDLHKYSNYYSKWYYIFQTSHHNTQYLFLSLQIA